MSIDSTDVENSIQVESEDINMKHKMYFITSMVIFGTIGIFVKNINLPSSAIALSRGFIGSLFLLAVFWFNHQKLSWKSMKINAVPLLVASVALAGNWILLFQAYKYTSIANAALSYYFAPVFVMAMSPIVLKEKLNPIRVACIMVAILGMLFIVSSSSRDGGSNNLLGINYGLAAAAFYATLVLSNKFVQDMNGLDTTLIELSITTILLIPYILVTEKVAQFKVTEIAVACIIILGIVHTGLGFYFYFMGMKGLPAQNIALLSYIDPLTALFVSFLILGEGITGLQIVGAILLLSSTFISELCTLKSRVSCDT